MPRIVFGRILILLALLTMASLMTMAVVHARETPTAAALECSGSVHGEADGGRSAPDADHALPHHHGTCHGPAMDIGTGPATVAARAGAGAAPWRGPERALRGTPVGPPLRPPSVRA